MATTIYDRDFSKLTSEESSNWQVELDKEIVEAPGSLRIRKSRYPYYPKAARHYNSLFPGHFLDPVDLQNQTNEFNLIIDDFYALINNNQTGERQILEFIKIRKAYFLIGALLKGRYPFGHHSLYIFPEFQLGVNYKADYLLVGKNSDGYHFVFIELEDVNGKITTTTGDFGSVIRKGLIQLGDWDAWVGSYFSHLPPIFEKALREGDGQKNLPKDFTTYDRTKVHFMVIAGRRNNFKDKTRRLRRNLESSFINILHYDNLIDHARMVIGAYTY